MSHVTCTLIGAPDGAELRAAADWCEQHPGLRVVSRSRHVPDAGAGLEADIIIVFQDFSDQYGAKTVNRLIGQTLGRRLFCCYGPWCASDGRTHDIWPTALRIPSDQFREFLDHELSLLAAGAAPLPPTASGEELFARWHFA